MRPPWVSATKISPLGAIRMVRGPDRVANWLTVKPAGVFSAASAGLGFRLATAAAIALDGGLRSAGVIFRTTPGASVVQSP